MRIVHAFGDQWRDGYSTGSLKYQKDIDWPFANDSEPKEVRCAIEDVLMSVIEDYDVFPGLFVYNGTQNPRVCDLSAEVLTDRWKLPEKYAIAGTIETRHQQRQQLKFIWFTRRFF